MVSSIADQDLHLVSTLGLLLLNLSLGLLEEQQVHGRENARLTALHEAQRHLDKHLVHVVHAVRGDVQRRHNVHEHPVHGDQVRVAQPLQAPVPEEYTEGHCQSQY